MGNSRRLTLNGTVNARDLGGYPAENGKTTKYRVFIRSAIPQGLTRADEELLLNHDIKTIVDLRSDEELQRNASHFAGLKEFDYHHLHFKSDVNDVKFMMVGQENIGASYLEKALSPAATAIFKTLANCGGGCLYHCSVGKERTGIVSAVLLMNCGVNDEDIIADYIITKAYLTEMVKKLSSDNPDLPAYIMDAKYEYMAEFLSLFHERFSSAADYLKHIGLEKSETESLKEKLLP